MKILNLNIIEMVLIDMVLIYILKLNITEMVLIDIVFIDTKTKYDSNGFDRHGINQYTKTKYDSNGFDIDGKDEDTESKYNRNGFGRYGFDRDGKHEYTGIFLNNENINWLKNKDEFLKLYNEIIKNGEFSENINKKNISSYEFKKIIANILNGKVDDNKMIKK